MRETTIKLSIVIVNFNSERFLKKCLESVCKKIDPKINIEIIIVNNDERENLEKIKNDFPQLIIADNYVNRGFGQGCNKGAESARGKYLLFLNPDTEILSDNIEEVLNLLEKEEIVGIIGSCLLTRKGKVQEWSAGTAINIYDLARNNLGIPRSRKIWESKKQTPAFWVAGTAMFIGKKLFDQLGGIDENIFMYFEDVDLCQRARQLGKEVIYFPSFCVLHKSGESYSNKAQQKKNYYESQQYYFEKHCGKIQAWLLKILRKIFT